MSINFVNFFWQCVALTVWIALVGSVYMLLERMVVTQLDAHKQRLAAAYLLWLGMGLFGAHRIYCNRIMTGLAQFAVSAVLLLLGLALDFYTVIPAVLWLLADALLIPGWIRSEDAQAGETTAQASAQASRS
jgi:TM2 domain-containing membrane protein YozV